MEYDNLIGTELEMFTAADVDPKEINWLWYPYIPFGKVTVLAGDSGDGKSTAEEDSYTVGLLTGVYEDTPAPVGSYVLQNNNDKVGFYKVAEGSQPSVPANKCYLTAPASSAKALSLGDATAIEAIEALTSGNYEAIYSTSGARLNSLQKGVNIVKMANGKTQKILVK